jgi:uncharacterized protein YjbJ (UPF0337 family)
LDLAGKLPFATLAAFALDRKLVRSKVTFLSVVCNKGSELRKEKLMWNKDEIKGKGKQIEGSIKDKAGKLVGNPKLEAKGEAERVAGKIQEKSGAARRKTGEAVVKTGKAFAGKL